MFGNNPMSDRVSSHMKNDGNKATIPTTKLAILGFVLGVLTVIALLFLNKW